MRGGTKRIQISLSFVVKTIRWPAFDPFGAGNATSRSPASEASKYFPPIGVFRKQCLTCSLCQHLQRLHIVHGQRPGESRMGHVFGVDERVELFTREETELHRG